MRIANIIEEGRLGGPQVRIANVACALKDRVQTTVILPEHKSEQFQSKLAQCNIGFKLFNITRITKELSMAIRYGLFSLFEIIQLTVYFRKQKFDLVHVSGGAWQYKGVIAGSLSGTKLVWHLNDTSMPKFFRFLFSLLSELPDAYIFASERTSQYYGNLIPENKKRFVVPAPVDTQQFKPSDAVMARRLSENGKITVGTTANVNPIKGLELFIEVSALLDTKFDNLQFVIVGAISENQQKYFQQLVKMASQLGVSNLHFLGQVEDVRAELVKMDIYLCTSVAESSPISVWEAMSMARPIISTDVGDVAEYIEPGVSGEIISDRDADKMTEYVSRLIEQPALRESYGLAARDIAIKHLDIALCAERHFAAYNAVIN
ncbi:MAG: glycosyltransferase family 4 protein [Gammaproteobacteria bacterium]|nr:glycosyltransferase family 4 protein [Gammaproteobacteria bacterium]